MKKFLLLIFMGFLMIQGAYAQAIEIYGKGVKNVNPATIVISDPGTVDYVVVEAGAVFREVMGDPAPGQVKFSDANETYVVDFNLAELDYAPTINNGGDQKWGYYTATFNDVDGGGIILDNMGQGNFVVSFVVYIYRNCGNPDLFHIVDYNHAFVWKNGAANPLVYNFVLPENNEPRDIEIVVPFSELSNDTRCVIVTAKAGTITETSEFVDNNMGDLLRLDTILLTDVPGDVTEVVLEIYSPILEVDDKVGDSFLTGAVLLSTVATRGCTLTQGYWKTHSVYGPASKPDETWDLLGGPDIPFYLSGMSYLEVLNTPPKGNAYYNLAHQYIAAELNFLAGADNSAVADVFDLATTYLLSYSPADIKGLKGNNATRKAFIYLGGVLEDYNSGDIGPGHCCDECENMEKSAQLSDNDILTVTDFEVFPNPVSGNAMVTFNPVFDGITKVDLYNLTGQKTTTLFQQNVVKNVPVNFTFDGSKFNEGMYLLVLQNGSYRLNTKIVIGK